MVVESRREMRHGLETIKKMRKMRLTWERDRTREERREEGLKWKMERGRRRERERERERDGHQRRCCPAGDDIHGDIFFLITL